MSLLEAKEAKDKQHAQKEEAREAFGVRDYLEPKTPHICNLYALLYLPIEVFM